MGQLPLAICDRLAYSGKNFITHSGVRNLLEQLYGLCYASSFRIAYVIGPRRSGKTHTAIKLCELISQKNLFPRLLDGSGLAEWLTTWRAENCDSEEVLVIDDAHLYLNSITPGASGALVNLIEALRVRGAKCIFFSTMEIADLPCDEHIKSRLIPGKGFRIEPPAEEELNLMISVLAKQRGYKLQGRKLGFLEKRLGRDIKAIEDYLDRVHQLSRTRAAAVKMDLLGDAL